MPRHLLRVGTIILLTYAIAAENHPLRGVTIDLSPVGNPGNVADQNYYNNGRHGAVAYPYSIGTKEVTNAQYVDFLNAKAGSDPLDLYNPLAGSNVVGGITRNGDSGSYTYEVKENMGNKPVNYVSWYDALRFANWLHNGQGNSDTETGAYTLLGGTATPSNGLEITRDPTATWYLPSWDEWHKAAYYDPRTTAEGGPPADAHYWSFPTKSNGVPVVATATVVGDINNPGANVANYGDGAKWNGTNPLGNVTTVGSAGPLSTTYYNTFDQAGNVWERTDTLFDNTQSLASIAFGGAYSFGLTNMRAGSGLVSSPESESPASGFRVAYFPAATLPGDVNYDGIVNGQDITLIATNWLHVAFAAAGDANHNGVVNGQDIALIASHWLYTSADSQAATVPEPATIYFAALSILALRGFCGGSPRKVPA